MFHAHFVCLFILKENVTGATANTALSKKGIQQEMIQFDDDGMDKMMVEHSFPSLPAVVADNVKSHINYVKKLAFYEGRIALIKKAKNASVPLHGCALSSLDFGILSKEHLDMGPLIETKFKPKSDFIVQFADEVTSMERERDSYKAKLEESRLLLKCMLTPGSFELVIDLLDRTLKDIKSNVGKSNDNLYRNYASAFHMDKLLGFRWRTFLKDISVGSKQVTLSDSFNNLIDSRFSGGHDNDRGIPKENRDVLQDSKNKQNLLKKPYPQSSSSRKESQVTSDLMCQRNLIQSNRDLDIHKSGNEEIATSSKSRYGREQSSSVDAKMKAIPSLFDVNFNNELFRGSNESTGKKRRFDDHD